TSGPPPPRAPPDPERHGHRPVHASRFDLVGPPPSARQLASTTMPLDDDGNRGPHMDIRPRARHLAVIVSAAVLGLFVTPAPAGAGGVSGLVEGPAHPVGAGNARTYVTVDEEGTPATIGVRLDAAALDDLPSALLPVTEAYVLELPEEAAATAFDHVTVDWNSHGHDPQHGFDVPHFDVHFYLLDR